MNLAEAKYGDPVVYTGAAGSDWDRDRAAKRLVKGCIYHVDSVNVGPAYVDVFLKEFPGVFFNAVLFAKHDSTRWPLMDGCGGGLGHSQPIGANVSVTTGKSCA